MRPGAGFDGTPTSHGYNLQRNWPSFGPHAPEPPPLSHVAIRASQHATDDKIQFQSLAESTRAGTCVLRRLEAPKVAVQPPHTQDTSLCQRRDAPVVVGRSWKIMATSTATSSAPVDDNPDGPACNQTTNPAVAGAVGT